jgi:dihydroxyacetone kinase-like protein
VGNSDAITLEILRRITEVMRENAEELTRLDSAIGDGDHGTNMARGFNAVLPKVEAMAGQPPAALLKTTATTLISTVGGAAGPLYGTAFLRAATALDGKNDIDEREVLAAFDAALEGIKARGKASPGEKTMVDALTPAVDALRAAVEQGLDLPTALDHAAAAARTGMEATIPMLATKGRASYLGERSIGHQDPGATSSYLIVQAIADVVRENSG